MRVELTAVKEMSEFPSGSGIEFYDDKVYLVGDDAHDILVMNRKWKPRDLITLFGTSEERLLKSQKANPKTSTLIFINKKPHLFIPGSGLNELNNNGILLNLQTKETLMFDAGVFYERLKNAGISELNIEGAALVHDYLILSNRGSVDNPVNHLVITSADFYKKQEDVAFQLVKLEAEQSAADVYVSGIAYSDKHETLLLAISSNSSYSINEEPGESGRLGLIENFYRKIGREKGRMKINEMIDLGGEDEKFKGHKIESLCIQSEKDHSMKIHLTAGSKDGITYLFKAQLKVH